MGFFSESATNKPWEGRRPLFHHVQQHVVPSGLSPGVDPLPDEELDSSKVHWAPGALDGVAGRHFSTEERPDLVNELAAAITSWSRRPVDHRLVAVYTLTQDDGFVGVVDDLCGILMKKASYVGGYATLGRWLMRNAAHRGPVKLGVALVGLAGDASDRPMLHLLGRHEEFTLFVAVALGRISEDWVLELWELAKHVHGWGRVHVVERLCQQRDPRLMDWLIREGFKNSVMDEYLAVPCAEAGNLHVVVGTEAVDDALLASIARLISAMITGGPARDISDYAQGAEVVESYLNHVSWRPEPPLPHLVTISIIDDYFAADGSAWAERYANGWTPAGAQRCRDLVATLCGLPHWEGLARRDFNSDDHKLHWAAMRALDILKFDTFDLHFHRLVAQPNEPGRWYQVMRRCTHATIDVVVSYAEQVIPLSEVAKPDEAVATKLMPSGWYACLDFILQDLRKYPEKGWPLIAVGLKSSALRNRNMAMMALAKWGRPLWPIAAEAVVKEAIAKERNEKVRLNLVKVLAGESID